MTLPRFHINPFFFTFLVFLSCSQPDPSSGPVCGNGLLEEGETCDGPALGGKTCVDLGYVGGTLGCLSDCSDFDDTSCDGATGPVCGDNLAEGSEVCDGSDLRGKTCITQGWDGGILRCASGCGAYNTVGCWFNSSGSCPYVYLPDGKDGWHYQGDLSGSTLASGITFFKPEFYGDNLYDLGAFSPADGHYDLRLREVIFETSYIDRAALVLVDVPAGARPYTTWSYTSQLGYVSPSGFVTTRAARAPVSAVREDGTDVLAQVREADGTPLPVKSHELSRVILDFGPIANPQHAKLILTAWGVYEDFRATQKPPFSSATVIETQDARGRWIVRRTAGKAAGDAKTWAIELAGVLSRDNTRLRLTMAHNPSVLDVLDAVALDDSSPVTPKVTIVAPQVATLLQGGATRVTTSTLKNRIHATDEKLPLREEALMTGMATKYGDVRPLLAKTEDQFVIMVHGDELALRFKAPAPRPGHTRHVFLLANMWYQLKNHPFGRLSDTIEPLPFAGMKTYPYAPALWPHRNDRNYADYLKTWNTRKITR
ncbi:MAG: hypothetical protein CVU59_02440 [Deltaproteobacteria bacterium HGW-Deltaproteobacteria-17]|nr:MAG: hypothetical protein CVU59_02440 [Deltaproteobacteria bacterium HGW-Deltaproteobacteria-17]